MCHELTESEAASLVDEQQLDLQAWETPCPQRPDNKHCVHWYDGDACCTCGDALEGRVLT